ncbi:MAG: class I SAM-dependent RNA methyltransferase [Alkalispirochaeta sp.]
MEKLVNGGAGLVRTDDQTILVPGAIPGETVEVSLQRRRRGVTIASLRRVVEASPFRVEPPCPYFGRCGGCDWQHIEYTEQIRWKRKILAEDLRRLGRIELPEETIEILSSEPYGYRSRVRLHGSNNGAGFRMRRSERIVPVAECPVATAGINAVIPKTGPSGATLIDSGTTRFRSDHDRVAEYDIDGVPFRFAIDGFAQSNRRLLSPLGETLRAALRTTRVIDLYAGAGLLPFLLLLPGNDRSPIEEIVCVEPDRRNTPFIARNIASVAPDVRLSVENETAEGWVAGSAGGGAATVPPAAKTAVKTAPAKPAAGDEAAGVVAGADCTVLLDPPRGGIHPAVAAALVDPGTEAPDIFYLSCDSAALARDLGILGSRYRIDSMLLIDFFPQTAHIETLVVLRPRDGVP